jgi:protein gp37
MTVLGSAVKQTHVRWRHVAGCDCPTVNVYRLNTDRCTELEAPRFGKHVGEQRKQGLAISVSG